MAGNIIENPVDLQRGLSNIAENVITSVSNDLLVKLKESIMQNVYLYDPRPNRVYYNGTGRPTYQFFNAFQLKAIQTTLTDVTRELFYNWQSMSVDTATFLHGNPREGDLRERLAELLDVQGFDEGFFGGKLRNEFWTNFINEFFADTHELDFLFAKYLLKYQS